MSKYDTISIGTQYGDWVVVGACYIRSGYATLSCKCKCGTVKEVDAYTLVSGKSKSCKFCSLPRTTFLNPGWKGFEEIPQSWFHRFVMYSKKNEFEITIEQVWNLYLLQNRKCALTNLPIDFVHENKRGDKIRGIKCSASIDRKNSLLGYTLDNIQLVHKDVNIMKNKYDQEHFINICKLVAKHNP